MFLREFRQPRVPPKGGIEPDLWDFMVPYLGALITRILLIRVVYYWGPLFSENPYRDTPGLQLVGQ